MEDQYRMYKWLVLTLISINMFFSAVAGMMVSPLFQEIALEIPITKAQMGMIIGNLMLASIFFSSLAGGLSDKIGCRWICGAAILITGVAGGLRYFVHSPTALMLSMFGIGIGVAILMPLTPKILSSMFPIERLTTVNGIAGAAFGLGGAVAMGTSVRFLSPAFHGWRGIALVSAGISIAMGLLWLVLYRDRDLKQDDPAQHGNMINNFKKILKIKDLWFLIIAYPFLCASPMSLQALLPVIFQEKGVANAGELVSVFMFANLIFLIIGGIVSDKIGRRKNLVVILGLVFAAAIPCFLFLTGTPLVLALIVAGIASGPTAYILITATIEMEQVGSALAGTAIGVLMMVGTLGSSFGPGIVGKLIDLTGSPWPGFLFLALCSIFSGLIILPSKIK